MCVYVRVHTPVQLLPTMLNSALPFAHSSPLAYEATAVSRAALTTLIDTNVDTDAFTAPHSVAEALQRSFVKIDGQLGMQPCMRVRTSHAYTHTHNHHVHTKTDTTTVRNRMTSHKDTLHCINSKYTNVHSRKRQTQNNVPDFECS